jgi:hypothetical protein
MPLLFCRQLLIFQGARYSSGVRSFSYKGSEKRKCYVYSVTSGTVANAKNAEKREMRDIYTRQSQVTAKKNAEFAEK